jgi:hypothetical protein
MHYAILMADRDVADNQPLLPADLFEAGAESVPLTDRDGNHYTGRLVHHCDTWTQVCGFLKRALETGQLPDGTPVPDRSLVAVELAKAPRRPAPLKFAPNR